MSSSIPNNQAGREADASFDKGASSAMSNTEFSSSIYESPNSIQSNHNTTRTTQPTSLAGELISNQDVVGSGTAGKAQESQSSRKPKDTAGASAMIL
ncbi:hypothetical protein F5X99DRAFT_382432 [Biscogniauxia marginata]|nr:hypothetical protein F5X99DRAFT_382432 [Biscogniauxia marginata]